LFPQTTIAFLRVKNNTEQKFFQISQLNSAERLVKIQIDFNPNLFMNELYGEHFPIKIT